MKRTCSAILLAAALPVSASAQVYFPEIITVSVNAVSSNSFEVWKSPWSVRRKFGAQQAFMPNANLVTPVAMSQSSRLMGRPKPHKARAGLRLRHKTCLARSRTSRPLTEMWAKR